jgi:hypothetical protein
MILEPIQHSRYSDWLRAGRSRGQSSSGNSGKIFLLSASFIQSLGPTQPLVQWVPGAHSANLYRGQEYVVQYIHSPIRLHVIVLN